MAGGARDCPAGTGADMDNVVGADVAEPLGAVTEAGCDYIAGALSAHGAVALTLTVALRPLPCWLVLTPVKPCARQRSANAPACSAVQP